MNDPTIKGDDDHLLPTKPSSASLKQRDIFDIGQELNVQIEYNNQLLVRLRDAEIQMSEYRKKDSQKDEQLRALKMELHNMKQSLEGLKTENYQIKSEYEATINQMKLQCEDDNRVRERIIQEHEQKIDELNAEVKIFVEMY